jgi:hypothetical protein
MRRHKDLQPWLDYFEMLRTYEEKGFLEVNTEKHEVFVTQPAMYTLAGCTWDAHEQGISIDVPHFLKSVCYLVRRLRVYAAWKSQEGPSYEDRPFALNVVKPDMPHDLMHTIVLTTRRRWWKLWMKHDSYEVVNYN